MNQFGFVKNIAIIVDDTFMKDVQFVAENCLFRVHQLVIKCLEHVTRYCFIVDVVVVLGCDRLILQYKLRINRRKFHRYSKPPKRREQFACLAFRL